MSVHLFCLHNFSKDQVLIASDFTSSECTCADFFSLRKGSKELNGTSDDCLVAFSLQYFASFCGASNV